MMENDEQRSVVLATYVSIVSQRASHLTKHNCSKIVVPPCITLTTDFRRKRVRRLLLFPVNGAIYLD